jgi:hypothetical protein
MWRPSGEESDESFRHEPPKPPKQAFEGFEGSAPGAMPNSSNAPDLGASMEIAAADGTLPDDPAKWRRPFAQWLVSACARDPRCCGGVGCLHLVFCEWMISKGGAHCKRLTFECLLRESGFIIDEVAGVALVSGLTFREDADTSGL